MKFKEEKADPELVKKLREVLPKELEKGGKVQRIIEPPSAPDNAVPQPPPPKPPNDDPPE